MELFYDKIKMYNKTIKINYVDVSGSYPIKIQDYYRYKKGYYSICSINVSKLEECYAV